MSSDNMDISQRAVIRYLGLKDLPPQETWWSNYERSMVKKWAAEFKRGREILEDDPRPRRPVTVTISSWQTDE